MYGDTLRVHDAGTLSRSFDSNASVNASVSVIAHNAKPIPPNEPLPHDFRSHNSARFTASASSFADETSEHNISESALVSKQSTINDLPGGIEEKHFVPHSRWYDITSKLKGAFVALNIERVHHMTFGKNSAAWWAILMVFLSASCLCCANGYRKQAGFGNIDSDSSQDGVTLSSQPYNFPRRSRRSRDALTVEADSATDRSDLEWSHPDAIALSGAVTSGIDIVAPHWSADSLNEVLGTHSTEIVSMWTQNQLEHFAKELSRGKARLAREGEALVRVVDVLIVLVYYERDKLVLQEFAHPPYKGVADEEVYIKECTVKSRFNSLEGFKECAERCLQKLGTGIGRFIEVVPDILGMREERRVLRSAHPGLSTLMQYYVVKARVVATARPDLEDLGLVSRTLHVEGYIYNWQHLDKVPYVKRHLKQSWGASRQGAVTWMGLSHSFMPVLPWTESTVLKKLGDRGLPGSAIPPPDAMKALLQNLSEGRVSLAVRTGSSPRLVCVEEKISVLVKSPRQGLILKTGDSEDGTPMLPSVPRHASDSYWRTAVRLSQTELGLSAPIFQMESRVLGVSDKVEDQEFWEHVTREYILQGPLIDCGFRF